MPEIPRDKGQFVQAATYVPVVSTALGVPVSVDGTVGFDQQLLVEEYPFLYAVIGDTWTDPGKGDVVGVTFRTPPQSVNLINDATVTWRIRF